MTSAQISRADPIRDMVPDWVRTCREAHQRKQGKARAALAAWVAFKDADKAPTASSMQVEDAWEAWQVAFDSLAAFCGQANAVDLLLNAFADRLAVRAPEVAGRSNVRVLAGWVGGAK